MPSVPAFTFERALRSGLEQSLGTNQATSIGVGEMRNMSRLEVIEGPADRLNWPDEVKAHVVAESFGLGATVSAVAGSYCPPLQHLTRWRRLAREVRLILPSADDDAIARLVADARLPHFVE